MSDRLKKCCEFILELEKLKSVERKIKPVGLDRYENSAEHSWQIAVFALALAEFANEPVDTGKVVKMLLVHDICEIDAKDVMFFDENGRAEAKALELKAVERIFGILPESGREEFFALWNEFENGTSAEAKYARAVDRVMPILQNLNNGMQSWKENGITKEQVLDKTSYIEDGSAELWSVISRQIAAAFDAEQDSRATIHP